MRNLLEQGADPNQQGGLPLWNAAFRGYEYITVLLLNWGADPNNIVLIGFEEIYESTPLMCAIYKGHDEIAMLLIDANAYVNMTARIYGRFGLYSGTTALDIANQVNRENIAQILRAAGAMNIKQQHILSEPQRQILHSKQFQREELKLHEILTFHENQSGLLHSNTLLALEALMSEYLLQNNYRGAEELLMRTFKARQQALGQMHFFTIEVLDRLAETCRKYKSYTMAEEAYKQLEQIYRTKSILDSEKLHFVMQRLVLMYKEQCRYAKAEFVLANILKEVETLPLSYTVSKNSTIFTNKAQRLIQVLNEIARLYRDWQKFSKSEKIYYRLLIMHTDYEASTKSVEHIIGLIALLKLQKAYQAPEQLSLRLLDIYTTVLGATHPLTIQTLNSLSEFYKQQENYPKAEELYLQLLRLQEKLFARIHLNCIITLAELKTVYQRSGDQSKLEATYLDLLERRKQALGLSHPDTAQTINNIASLYGHQGRDKEAIDLYQQLVTIQEEALGAKDAKTCAARNNLERLLRKTNVATYQPSNIAPTRTVKPTATGYAIPTPPRQEPQVFALNMESVQQKIEETVQVHQLLAVHFTEEELPPLAVVSASISTEPQTPSANSFKSLSTPYFVFLNMLLRKPVWKPKEIDGLALPLGLLAHGAMEHLNDMTFEACNEPLFEGNDPIEINISLAKELLA